MVASPGYLLKLIYMTLFAAELITTCDITTSPVYQRPPVSSTRLQRYPTLFETLRIKTKVAEWIKYLIICTGINTRRQVTAPLVQPRYQPKNYGEWAFSVAAPLLWNALPPLKTFKTQLKTHLFRTTVLEFFLSTQEKIAQITEENKTSSIQLYNLTLKMCKLIALLYICNVLLVLLSKVGP
ncbi:hypothetical protein GQR58_025729 [Nymphon striatum]|nr:hypothetical protein GQR58_025729 [Nymphon striatum]